MAGIDKRIARSVLEEVIDGEGVHQRLWDALEGDPDRITGETVGRLMLAAVGVRRRNTREHGEVVTLTFRVPDDPTDES